MLATPARFTLVLSLPRLLSYGGYFGLSEVFFADACIVTLKVGKDILTRFDLFDHSLGMRFNLRSGSMESKTY